MFFSSPFAIQELCLDTGKAELMRQIPNVLIHDCAELQWNDSMTNSYLKLSRLDISWRLLPSLQWTGVKSDLLLGTLMCRIEPCSGSQLWEQGVQAEVLLMSCAWWIEFFSLFSPRMAAAPAAPMSGWMLTLSANALWWHKGHDGRGFKRIIPLPSLPLSFFQADNSHICTDCSGELGAEATALN